MVLLDDSNPLRGAFGRHGAARSDEAKDREALRWGLVGLVLSLLWIFGIGSLLGIAAGFLAQADATSKRTRALGAASVLLGLFGLAIALALVVA